MKSEQFTSVASRLRPRLLAVAMQYEADIDGAEDAVQEAMMRLWTAWEGLPEVEDAERLAVRLTKYACIDAYRQRQRLQRLKPKDEATNVATANVEDALHEAELQKALDKAVAALPPAERRMWTMFSEAQMKNAEISASTGIQVNSVRAIISAARHHIIEIMKKGGML